MKDPSATHIAALLTPLSLNFICFSYPSRTPPSSPPGEVIMMKPDMAAMKKYKSLRDLAPESAAMTLVQDTFALCVDLFKLAMASMLSVFVPQECPGSGGPAMTPPQQCDECTCTIGPHDCSFSENFRCLSQLNAFVLAWNFICLATLLFHYFLVWKREHFIILHFKETLTLGRLHVRDIITDYPTVQIRLRNYNKWVRRQNRPEQTHGRSANETANAVGICEGAGLMRNQNRRFD